MAVLLAGVAAAHLARWDGLAVVVWAVAATPWLFLAAWPVAATSVRSRRWWRAALAGVLVGLGLWWTLPGFWPAASGPAPATGAAGLRIFDQNVTWTNRRMGPVAAAIAARHPDVVALEEITPPDIAALDATGVLRRFRWHLVLPARATEGLALYSDVPLSGLGAWNDAGHPALEAVAHLPGEVALPLLVVHTYYPVNLPLWLWRGELSGIAAAVRARPGPLVVVGDFNATRNNWEFGRILASGVRDAAVEAGKGWEMTWSPHAHLPALLRIDHVLVSPQVGVRGYRVDEVAGSNHRSLTVTVAAPAAPAGQ